MPVGKNDLQVGDNVEYHPVGGSVQLSTGVVEDIITETQVYITWPRSCNWRANKLSELTFCLNSYKARRRYGRQCSCF